jgi:SAM-dependent methyltransferase
VEKIFEPGSRILDLGCGTGEDAVWLAGQGMRVTAMDISSGMLDVARKKAEAAGLLDRISFTQCDLASLPEEELHDGALSNFGPLNCIEDLRPFSSKLAGLLKPGAKACLVIMGPACPWEMLWYLLHLKPGQAFRRFRKGLDAPVGGGRTVKVWYPSPGNFQAQLQPHFRKLELIGMGSLVPPPYLDGLVAKAKGLFHVLARIEDRMGGLFPLNRWNDHYLMVMERNG